MLVVDFSWSFFLYFMLELFCLLSLFLNIFNSEYSKENVMEFGFPVLKSALSNWTWPCWGESEKNFAQVISISFGTFLPVLQ